MTNSPQISNRWSTFRQGVAGVARALVSSSESSYGLGITDDTDPERVQTSARDLLFKDAYHFGKTTAVSTQATNQTLS